MGLLPPPPQNAGPAGRSCHAFPQGRSCHSRDRSPCILLESASTAFRVLQTALPTVPGGRVEAGVVAPAPKRARTVAWSSEARIVQGMCGGYSMRPPGNDHQVLTEKAINADVIQEAAEGKEDRIKCFESESIDIPEPAPDPSGWIVPLGTRRSPALSRAPRRWRDQAVQSCPIVKRKKGGENCAGRA